MTGTQWAMSTENEAGQVGRGEQTQTYGIDACMCIKSFHFEGLEKVVIIVFILLMEKWRLPRFKQLAQVTQLTKGKSRISIWSAQCLFIWCP